MNKYYPIMLDIRGKKCKVIGGGKVAERKVIALLEHGAVVTVISPLITDKLDQLHREKKIALLDRKYIYGDLDGSYLVYAATDDRETNKICLNECREKGILLNVVDEGEICDFIVPAKISRGHLNICISTDGKSPMLSRRIKERLERIFTEEYEEYLEILGEIRERVKREVASIDRRREIFYNLVYSDVFDRYLTGEDVNLKEELYSIYLSNFKLQGVDSDGEERNNSGKSGE